ncbi:MAG: ABC transporter ATP-binding protein [Opitutales bacterium]|nr:ABC transporter ATP-binding protein [Opitutales bacterium]
MAKDLKIDCLVRFRGDLTIYPQATFSGEGKVTALYGPSGGGKTTILRLIAGLLRPDSGTIHLGADIWHDSRKKIFVAPQKRKIGMVFQDYALFPHLSVMANVVYAIKGDREEIFHRAEQLMKALEISDLQRRKPSCLSGGQRQRVALARAVVRQPDWLLLDEPMAALDEKTKRRVRSELRQFLQTTGIPSLLVTHHPEDLDILADRIAIVEGGKIHQHGNREEVMQHPRNDLVAEILGYENILTSLCELPDPLKKLIPQQNGESCSGLAFHAGDLKILAPGETFPSPGHRLPASLVQTGQTNSLYRVTLECHGVLLHALSLEPPPPGPLELGLHPCNIRALPAPVFSAP